MWATKGYAVLVSDHRASLAGGAGAVERARQAQQILDLCLDDISRGADASVARGVADPSRVALVGHSYGAYLVMGVAATPSRYRAVVVREGLADFRVLWNDRASSEIAQRILAYQHLGTPEQVPPNWTRSSPVTRVACSSSPTPIVSGEPSRGQGDLMRDALQSVWTPVRQDVYDDGHVHPSGRPAAVAVLGRRVRLVELRSGARAGHPGGSHHRPAAPCRHGRRPPPFMG